ncbi:MAG: cyclase family protein [Acidobacteriota bacterium]|nr:MAG: cyclase family protein [Acidobacteriota bacterium]
MPKILAFVIALACFIAGATVFYLTRGENPPLPADRTVAVLDETGLVDLTWDFDDRTVYWPNAQPFQWEKESWGKSAGGFWYTAARYAASEHGGTHLDSPIHFAEGRMHLDEIPVSKLVGPAVVMDISAACEKSADYLLSVDDISTWEKTYGRIPDRSIVLVRTGWGKRWPDKKLYLGSDVPGDVANLHFPGISKEAAEFLAGRRSIDGIGIDTASIDHGPSKDFIAHRILNGANIYGLENVANLDKLPPTGATIIALPMKIKAGTGGPVRIIALLPK